MGDFAIKPRTVSAMPNLPPLIMGGAGWSYQLVSHPESSPVLEIVKAAFSRGVTAIDTSPYYEPSEELLGAALSHHDITSQYKREDFVIMTKCGRIAASQFDYSPEWIRRSVRRSLQRFSTEYLDVVFCHDVEFVPLDNAVEAVGTLFELVDQGLVKFAGISGYDLDAIIRVAQEVLRRFARPVDVVQNWAQLSLQNTRLESHGLTALRKLGVRAVCNASPLACGLLRAGGVPVGKLGDWHPAPADLRLAAQQASDWVSLQNESLASVSLRFAVAKAVQNSAANFRVSTITGISTTKDLDENIEAATRVLRTQITKGQHHDGGEESSRHLAVLNADVVKEDQHFFGGVRNILDNWVDYDLSNPAPSSPSLSELTAKSATSSQEEMPSHL